MNAVLSIYKWLYRHISVALMHYKYFINIYNALWILSLVLLWLYAVRFEATGLLPLCQQTVQIPTPSKSPPIPFSNAL